MLSFIIWLPIFAALILFLLPIHNYKLARWIALIPMIAVLAASLHVFYYSAASGDTYSYEVQYHWFPDLGISYHLGINHFNGMLIMLTSIVGVAAIGISTIITHARYFYALALIMIGGLAGAFASLDLFFLYIFHEFALIPTFILIGLWGGENRRHAAMKITLYLGFGSVILLFGLLGLYSYSGSHTFDLIALKQHLSISPIDSTIQIWLFGILFLGFGILISLFPFHTWAPIGYGEAPPLAAMLHAGVIKKFGLYGLLTIAAPLLPTGFQYWKPIIIWLAIGNLIYCGYVATQQKDLRYMLAYASVSHMGYAFLGFASWNSISIQGVILFLFAHGLSSAAAFGVAGYCREQTGTSNLTEMGGLAKKMPFAATVFTIAALAGCGLPGFANFPAEILIFFGSFNSFPLATVLALWTVVISAIYFLRAIRSAFLGPLRQKNQDFQSMDRASRFSFILLLIALLITGFWPRLILDQHSPEIVGQPRMHSGLSYNK